MIDRFLTGGYAEMEDFGVCRFAFDRERGFRAENKWAGFINPSFILPHPWHSAAALSIPQPTSV